MNKSSVVFFYVCLLEKLLHKRLLLQKYLYF